MYGNDNWINSYLDAILDAGKGAAGAAAGGAAARGRGGGGGGGGGGYGDRPSLLLRERGHFSPARYFVEEVITGYDETDLYKTWLRANAMRSPQEKNTRLENMTWRIWNLARKKKEVRLFALGSFLLSLRAACFVPDAVQEDAPFCFDNSIRYALERATMGYISG
ncbi:unnamed protein product [Urochloa humidicola]